MTVFKVLPEIDDFPKREDFEAINDNFRVVEIYTGIAMEYVNIGSAPNTFGDSFREAFAKVNRNFHKIAGHGLGSSTIHGHGTG